jgi:hypothetical protein
VQWLPFFFSFFWYGVYCALVVPIIHIVLALNYLSKDHADLPLLPSLASGDLAVSVFSAATSSRGEV